MHSEKRIVRCAIYTRKSSEEGLEQEFNSLDAQYEACSAYIASQKSEGWKRLGGRYDDGGISGGTLERPSLTRLMADIDAGRVDLVVVYKIDRLTRSLMDFVKLVERFDKANCSFVSVTQSFNTATSMGRLTLNVLLSFAQFEREVTAERIRDKIAASKKKGIWMGGIPPLGYRPKDRELIVEPAEAAQVRQIFALFLETQCLGRLKKEVDRLEMRTRPSWTGKAKGQVFRYSRGHLQGVLKNPIYVGDIRHKSDIHPGRHAAIIERKDWDKVQSILSAKSHAVRGRGRDGAMKRSPLTGRLFDEAGDRLATTYTRNSRRRLRYFVSARLTDRSPTRADDRTGWRVPAAQMEQAIAAAIRQALKDATQTAEGESAPSVGADEDSALLDLVEKARIGPGRVEVHLQPKKVAALLNISVANVPDTLRAFSAPFQRRRRGVETKLIFGHQAPAVDPVLLKWVARGWVWWKEIRTGNASLQELAQREKVSARFISMHLELAFMAPDVIASVVDGRHPSFMNAQALRTMRLPSTWAEQRSALAAREATGRN
jgi:DNA invertase Pin-like site-specific DNA recombinase